MIYLKYYHFNIFNMKITKKVMKYRKVIDKVFIAGFVLVIILYYLDV